MGIIIASEQGKMQQTEGIRRCNANELLTVVLLLDLCPEKSHFTPGSLQGFLNP